MVLATHCVNSLPVCSSGHEHSTAPGSARPTSQLQATSHYPEQGPYSEHQRAPGRAPDGQI